MNQGLLQWSRCCPTSLSSLSLSSSSSSTLPFSPKFRHITLISATLNSSIEDEEHQKLPARERRKLRKERREEKAINRREELEMRLPTKRKKMYASWTEELNLDKLSLLGPQWWIVRVSRGSFEYKAGSLARVLAKNYPDMEFKTYIPAVQEKRKLKNGSFSVKSKQLLPGCVFLRCVLNKELHDFVRECYGVGGFVGSKVGNTKRQIIKPRPVSEHDMEAMFRRAKEEQEKADKAFQNEQKVVPGVETSNLDSQTSDLETQDEEKPKRRTRKPLEPTSKERTNKLPKKGSTVKVVSGAFAEFSGILKALDRKNGRATVGFTLFGKTIIADVDLNDIVELVE